MALQCETRSGRGPRKLRRWQVVELINWCKLRQGKDEEQEFAFEITERGENEIAISVGVGRSETTLVVHWSSGRARIETRAMPVRKAIQVWAGIISEALDGKIEKAQHRGYFNCRVCGETVRLTGTVDIWTHLQEHDVKVQEVLVGDGISIKIGDKTRNLEDFLVGEDAPIH